MDETVKPNAVGRLDEGFSVSSAGGRTSDKQHQPPNINNRLGQKPRIVAILPPRHKVEIHGVDTDDAVRFGRAGCDSRSSLAT